MIVEFQEYFHSWSGSGYQDVNVVKLKNDNPLQNNVTKIYFLLKKLGYNRILIESGIKYINEVLKYNLIRNFYLFKSSSSIKKNGKNNTRFNLTRKLKLTFKNKVKVNLNGDILHKIQL